jgi:hypothetical protein
MDIRSSTTNARISAQESCFHVSLHPKPDTGSNALCSPDNKQNSQFLASAGVNVVCREGPKVPQLCV